MSGDEPMGLRVLKGHASIEEGLEWRDIPQFAVLTGANGAGKSQLLEVLAQAHGAWSPEALSRGSSDHQSPQSSLEISGPRFVPGEVFYARSLWPLQVGGSVSTGNVEEEILGLREGWDRDTPAPWYVSAIAQAAGVEAEAVRQMAVGELEKVLTPTILWGKSAPGRGNLALLFLAYRMFERLGLRNGLLPSEVVAKYGRPPWETFNEVLRAAALPFRVDGPPENHPYSLISKESYILVLRDTDRDCRVPWEKLSSGERVIMSLGLWLLSAEKTNQHYKLMLLDEPDAHLHPSMTKRFIDVLLNVFVRGRGVRVLMTTHSPSTVALVPEGSLFVMRRTGLRIARATSRADTVAQLTEGFVVAHEGMQIVMCEGKTDVPFYEAVWERITDPESSTPNALHPVPALLFVNGQGAPTVTQVVPQLRSHGLSHFHGLLDLDEGRQSGNGVHVIQRRALENYLLDPLVVWCMLLDERQVELPLVSGVHILTGQRHRLRLLPPADLQRITDALLDLVQRHMGALGNDEQARVDVLFTNGVKLQYPLWLLRSHKRALWVAFTKTFPVVREENLNRLITSFTALDMVPSDLRDLMLDIQGHQPGLSPASS